jgi:hypothetical protein
MNSVIFVIDVPKTFESPLATHAWQQFLSGLDHITNSAPGILKLSDNVFQIPLENGLPAFVQYGEDCRAHQYSYRVLFFEENPAWVTSKYTSR